MSCSVRSRFLRSNSVRRTNAHTAFSSKSARANRWSARVHGQTNVPSRLSRQTCRRRSKSGTCACSRRRTGTYNGSISHAVRSRQTGEFRTSSPCCPTRRRTTSRQTYHSLKSGSTSYPSRLPRPTSRSAASTRSSQTTRSRPSSVTNSLTCGG